MQWHRREKPCPWRKLKWLQMRDRLAPTDFSFLCALPINSLFCGVEVDQLRWSEENKLTYVCDKRSCGKLRWGWRRGGTSAKRYIRCPFGNILQSSAHTRGRWNDPSSALNDLAACSTGCEMNTPRHTLRSISLLFSNLNFNVRDFFHVIGRGCWVEGGRFILPSSQFCLRIILRNESMCIMFIDHSRPQRISV